MLTEEQRKARIAKRRAKRQWSIKDRMDFARKRLGITPKLKDQKLSGRLACKPKIVSVRRKVFGLFKVGKRGEPELVEKVAAPTMAAAVPILADGYGININPHKIRRHIHRTEGGYFCLQILWKS